MGPFLEADVVRGYVAANPTKDRSIIMCYTKDQEPPPFSEEQSHPNLFERRSQRGADWEIAFYRSITRSDGMIILGGANATNISGQIAIGSRIPLLALPEFGGAAAKVWETLSAGEDLPVRSEIDLMARPWNAGSAADCVEALLAQRARRRYAVDAPRPEFTILAAFLFLVALAIIPWAWGQGKFEVWMLFAAPLLAGGSGSLIRPMIDRRRGALDATPLVAATVVLGLVAGGIAGILFVTAQLTSNADLLKGDQVGLIVDYAKRTIPYAAAVGFIAGLTSDAVFGKLLGLDVVRTTGLGNSPQKTP